MANAGFIESMSLGAKKRAAGIAGLGLDLAEAMGGNFPETKQDLANLSNQYQQQGTGSGLTGFAGEVLGDPLTYVPFYKIAKAAGLVSKVAPVGISSLGKTGALAGGTSGLTQESLSGDSDIFDRLGNAATSTLIGGGVGLATPAIGNVVGGVKRVGRGLGERIGAAGGSKTATNRISDRMIADKLIEEGFTPQKVASALSKADKSGIRQTLGEATQSGSILGYESALLNSQGRAGQMMRQGVRTRTEKLLPKRIHDKASELLFSFKKSDQLYKKASQEGQKTLDRAKRGGLATMDARAIVDEAQSAVGNLSRDVKAAKTSLLDKKGTAHRALNRIQGMIETANEKGVTFDRLHQLKKEVSELYISGSDKLQQKKINALSSNYRKRIDETLSILAPNNYKPADVSFMEGLAGKEIRAALNKSKIGGLNQFYNKVWSSPDKQADFLRKLPSDEARNSWGAFMDGLQTATAGHSRAGSGRMGSASSQLLADIAGVNPSAISPLGWRQQVRRAMSMTYAPRLEANVAKKTLRPDSDNIVGAMKKRLGEREIGSGIKYGSTALSLQQPNIGNAQQSFHDDPYTDIIDDDPYADIE